MSNPMDRHEIETLQLGNVRALDEIRARLEALEETVDRLHNRIEDRATTRDLDQFYRTLDSLTGDVRALERKS